MLKSAGRVLTLLTPWALGTVALVMASCSQQPQDPPVPPTQVPKRK